MRKMQNQCRHAAEKISLKKFIELGANSLDKAIPIGASCLPMSPKIKIPEKITIRPKPEDYAIIQAGMKKHGLDQVQIIRMALRRFAESEKLQLAS